MPNADGAHGGQDDAELQRCVWGECRQREPNMAMLLKAGLVPEGLCQLKCKPAYCAWALQELASAQGYLGCTVTQFSSECAPDDTGPDLSWILPVVLGLSAACVCGVAGTVLLRMSDLPRKLKARHLAYQQRREAAKAEVVAAPKPLLFPARLADRGSAAAAHSRATHARNGMHESRPKKSSTKTARGSRPPSRNLSPSRRAKR